MDTGRVGRTLPFTTSDTGASEAGARSSVLLADWDLGTSDTMRGTSYRVLGRRKRRIAEGMREGLRFSVCASAGELAALAGAGEVQNPMTECKEKWGRL